MNTNTPCRVLLADDHLLVCEGLALIIKTQTDMEVVAKVGDGEQALEQARLLLPDVVVTDISMPKLNGLELTKRLRIEFPQIRILALSFYSDDGHVRHLLETGASGYMLKHSAADELIKAIRSVAQGDMYLDPGLSIPKASIQPNQDVGSEMSLPTCSEELGLLTASETETLKMFAHGHTNQEIADHSELTVQTVEGYKEGFGKKLGLKSRADIFQYAWQQGWLVRQS